MAVEGSRLLSNYYKVSNMILADGMLWLLMLSLFLSLSSLRFLRKFMLDHLSISLIEFNDLETRALHLYKLFFYSNF